MSDVGHQVMVDLQAAAASLDAQMQWGESAQDVALAAVLRGAQGAVAMFDQLAAQVTGVEQRITDLEARVTNLETAPPPPAPPPTTP